MHMCVYRHVVSCCLCRSQQVFMRKKMARWRFNWQFNWYADSPCLVTTRESAKTTGLLSRAAAKCNGECALMLRPQFPLLYRPAKGRRNKGWVIKSPLELRTVTKWGLPVAVKANWAWRSVCDEENSLSLSSTPPCPPKINPNIKIFANAIKRSNCGIKNKAWGDLW